MPTTLRCPNPACLRDLVVPDRAPPPGACMFCGVLFSATETLTSSPNRTALPQRSTAPPANPTRIGRFELRKKLGAGAFGTVYTARDPQLDRDVALKVPNESVLSDPGRVERFVREAKAVANLRHPNIVPVYEAGQDGGRYFIASALIDGQPLSDAIPDGGADLRKAAEWVRQLADALAYAHSEGVVHRDVKPQNVILDRKGNVHLTDFGLARRSGDTALPSSGNGTATDGRLTNDGDIVGTPAYMAPEQAAGKGGEVGPAADQYALGVVLYELIAGQTPFGGPPAVVIAALLTSDPPPPSKHRRGVPKDLESINRRAMAREPGQRYKSCRHFADDLRRYLDGDPIAGQELTDLERMFLWARRRPTAAGASVLGVVVVLLVVSMSVAAGLTSRAIQTRAFADAARDEAVASRDVAIAQLDLERKAAAAAAAAWDAERRAFSDKLDAERRAAADDLDAERRATMAERRAVAKGSEPIVDRESYMRIYSLIIDSNISVDRLHGLLDGIPARLRGWEWHWVRERRVNSRIVGNSYNPTVTLTGHKSPVNWASFSPDGRRVLTAGGDFSSTAQLWDANTGKELGPAMQHAKGVKYASFSSSGRRLTTASDDGTVGVWEADTGKSLVVLYAGRFSSFHSASFSPDDRRVVTSGGSSARIWISTTGREESELKGHKALVHSACFSPDGRLVVTASMDNTARIWDVQSAKTLLTIGGHTDRVSSASFSPDGKRVVTASDDKTARIWDANDGRELALFRGHNAEVRTASFSPDGQRVVTASWDRTARVWDVNSTKEIAILKGHTDRVSSASFSPDGRRLVTASWDNTAQVWQNVETPLRGIGFTSGNTRLVFATMEGVTGVCSVPDLDELPIQSPPERPLRTSPDKTRKLLVADGLAKLRDVETGIDVFTLPQKDVIDATFSPDGHWIATVGKDGSVRLYDGRPEPPPAKSP